MSPFLAQLDPIVWAAILTLIGVVVGHLISGWGKRQDHELAAVKLTVDTLQAQVKDLRGEVDGLRVELREAERRARISGEHYSAALAFVRVLIVRLLAANDTLRAAGLDEVPVPAPPDMIAPDMTPLD